MCICEGIVQHNDTLNFFYSQTESDFDQLRSLITMGTFSMVPMYVGYDSVAYFSSKLSWLLPLGTIENVTNMISSFGKGKNNRICVDIDKTEFTRCNEIICARHKKIRCEKCLLNNDLVLLT